MCKEGMLAIDRFLKSHIVHGGYFAARKAVDSVEVTLAGVGKVETSHPECF